MSSSAPPKIFLTGLPGCGKTTIIRGIAHRFAGLLTGFYTEEVREAKGRRVGFDLVAPGQDHRGRIAARWRLARFPGFAKHDVLRLLDAESLLVADLMLDGDEDQLPGAALLALNIGDGRPAPGR